MVAACVVLRWLAQTGLPTERIPPLIVTVFISGGIGLAVGYFVPYWYRSLPPETNVDAEMKGQIDWGARGRAMSV
jgi:hypothetical protein